MIALALLAATPFVLVERADPITLERQALFGTETEGNIFGLACRPEKHELGILVLPQAYYKPGFVPLIFEASGDSRFGSQPAPEKGVWYFDDTRMAYAPKGFKVAEPMARFIDAMAKDHEFNIRFSLSPSDIRTITFRYSIDVAALRQFLGNCGAKKVNAKLAEMGSPAAP